MITEKSPAWGSCTHFNYLRHHLGLKLVNGFVGFLHLPSGSGLRLLAHTYALRVFQDQHYVSSLCNCPSIALIIGQPCIWTLQTSIMSAKKLSKWPVLDTTKQNHKLEFAPTLPEDTFTTLWNLQVGLLQEDQGSWGPKKKHSISKKPIAIAASPEVDSKENDAYAVTCKRTLIHHPTTLVSIIHSWLISRHRTTGLKHNLHFLGLKVALQALNPNHYIRTGLVQ